MAIIGKNSRGGLAKTGGSTPVSVSSRTSKAPAGVDVAGRAASLATIAKTNPALAASLSPLATGGVQTSAQSAAATKAIQSNRPSTPVITPESLNATAPVSIPPPPAPVPAPDISATNAGLVGGGITTDATGKLVVTPTATPTADNKYGGVQNIFDSYLKQSQAIAPVNNEAIYNAQYKTDQIAQKQQAVNDITSQINTIVANRDANVLRVTGQGRGIPEAIIGGQQAQLNKEAAIAALPLQAQLAAAQGNLDTAQSHLDTMFRIKSSDATAKYNYNTKLLDSVFDFATKVEQNKIEDLRLSENRKYTEKQDFIKTQNEALKNALGQGAPASVYNAIKNATDINGVTIAAGIYNTDVLARRIQQAQLAKLMAPDTTVTPITSAQISETIQTAISDNNPVTVKSSLAALLGSDKVAPATKARISPSLAVLNSVDELANGNIEGQFTGVGIAGRIKEGFKGLFNRKSPEAITNAQNIEAINLKVQQWASGAALTDAQTKQVDRFTPTLNDSDKTVKTKLNGLYNFMLNQAESDLLTEGINVQFPSVNLFEISDLYGKASPEQRTLIEQTYFNK